VIRWAPRLRDIVVGRSQAASAAVVSDAQAMHVRAQADATASATWAALAAELRAEMARERAEHERRLAMVERAEADCRERADRIEWQAAQTAADLRAEMHAAVLRAHHRATPTHSHSAVISAADPLETPPDGHRLVAPPVPLRDDPDPTPDLPSSLTPSRAKTDPPT
jgi:hypothetical protein